MRRKERLKKSTILNTSFFSNKLQMERKKLKNRIKKNSWAVFSEFHTK